MSFVDNDGEVAIAQIFHPIDDEGEFLNSRNNNSLAFFQGGFEFLRIVRMGDNIFNFREASDVVSDLFVKIGAIYYNNRIKYGVIAAWGI